VIGFVGVIGVREAHKRTSADYLRRRQIDFLSIITAYRGRKNGENERREIGRETREPRVAAAAS